MDTRSKEKVQRLIDERREEILQLCSDMVRIPSENPPGDMGEMASFLRGFLEERGFAVEAYEPEKGRINLVARIGAGEPTLILNGHMDVVPAGDRERWDFPPYCGELREGKILGRGATDMKGGLTSLIAAFVAVSQAVGDLPGTLVLTIVPDEETGGEHGSRWLVETGKVRGEACLIGEPTSMVGSFVGEKGICWLRLSARGVPAHGSLPMLGENAIEKLAAAFPVLHAIEREEVEVPEDVREIVEASKALYRGMLADKGIADEAKLEAVAGALDHSTVNIGVIKGGSKVNIVPESCSADVDVRVPVGTTPAKVRDRVVELLRERGLADIECELVSYSNPNYTSPSEKIYALLSRNAKDILGIDLKPLFVTGATDGRFFRLGGIPAINYGPGELALAHAYNEYVRAEDVIRAAKVIAGTIVDFFGS